MNSILDNSLVSSSVVQGLAQRLRDDIQEQGLAPGSFFGTEADLARQYGVSHGIAREAAMHLKSLGILESRKRKGLLVRRPDPLELLAQSLPMLADSQEDVTELAQLRFVLEIGAIELAVAHASEPQIEQLENLAKRFEHVVRSSGSDEEENELELAFHTLILEMSGSRLIAGMQRVLARFFNLSQNRSYAQCPKDQTIWQHHALVAAIRDKDVDSARAMIRLHFKWVMDFDRETDW